ncbi:MAG: hypothetical protein AAGC55_26115, partial [Myxococcota bacterium]
APSLPPPPSKRGSPTGDVSLRRDGVGGTPRPPTPRSDGPPSVPPGGFAADVPDPSDAVTSFYDRISYAIEENWSWVLLGLSSLAIAIVSVLFAIAYLSMSVG